MVETIVTWKMPGLFKSADAKKCYEEITALGEEVKPEQIVNRARDEKSELHKCFEWDDSAAAEKYRLIQGRQIVQHLIVVQKEVEQPEQKEPIQFRVMMKNETGKDSGYKQTRIMVKDEDEYKKMLDMAWSELRAFKRKYACLSELAEIFALID